DQPGLAHLSGRLGDLVDPGQVLLDVLVRVGADVVPDRGARRDDVRLDAAVGDHVVDAGVLFDVLSHVVDADVHQLDRVERGAAAVRGGRGGGGHAGERVVDRDHRLAGAERDARLVGRVPGDRGVDVVEQAGPDHVNLADQQLLGRAAVDAHPPLDPGRP